MRLLVRLVAVFTALTVTQTILFIVGFVVAGRLGALLTFGPLAVLTILGWVVVLTAGPLTAVQLWRFRESGRRAGVLLFGYNVAYYAVGLVALRSPEASVVRIAVALAIFALPLPVLLSKRTRALCSGTNHAVAE